MRYICSICGYVYDEEKEKVPFAELPESWVCPWCRAPKALFGPEKTAESSPAPAEPAETAVMEPEGDMEKLSPGVLSALCSNLARGCEKQYQEEEAASFKKLADYFASLVPGEPKADTAYLLELLGNDLERGYPGVMGAAKEKGDRGTQRICVWGEKVTMILKSLVGRCQREGTAFLQGTEIWVCSVCGFVYVGDTPPQLCPVCKVPAWKFDRVEGRASV